MDKRSFFSVPFKPLRPRATEQQLEDIYQAAGLGLEGDQLALRIRMSPSDYRALRGLDPMVEAAEMLGKADKHAEIAQKLHEWAASGDKAAVKAAIAILQNRHGWFTKTQTDVTFTGQISISTALANARARVVDAEFSEVQDEVPEERRLTSDAVPTRQQLDRETQERLERAKLAALSDGYEE